MNNTIMWAYSLWIFNLNNLGIQLYRKQTYFISWGRLYEKVLQFFKKARKKYNWFWKETNVTVNKRRTKITSRPKALLHLWKKNLKKLSKSINYWKITVIIRGKYRGAAHSFCNLKFNGPNETSVVFRKGSNFIYHFIIKELASESEG